MKHKLLNKTLPFYLLFSLVVIIIAAPAFYVLTSGLFRHEADELLYLHKAEFLNSNYKTLTLRDVPVWNHISRDSKILDHNQLVTKDSLREELIPDTLDHELVPHRILLSPITIEGQQKIFMARVSLIESEALIANIAMVFCVILILLLVGLYFITRILSARLWKPFFSTISKLEAFELDKNVVPVMTETDIEEFDRLNNATKKLLEKNLNVFKSQKEFVENAAHELQTPIAAFLAKLEVMVQEMPINHQLGESLNSLQQSASRIVRINKNLLVLSKIENDQYASYEPVVLSNIVKRQSEFINQQMEEKRIKLQIEVSGNFVVSANLTLLEIAIGNLLLNALKHNIPDGEIRVNLEGNMLVISNSGKSSLQNEKLFQRFSTPGASGGSGLGLAIVKRIADQHRWQISYAFSRQMHHFTLVL